MINLLLLLLLITCFGITAAWVAENPGIVTIHWFDYRIDTSLAFLLLAGIAGALVLAWMYLVVRKLALAPHQLKQRRNINQYRKGLAELTSSVAALAAADIKGAETHTRKAEKLLGRTPLTLLLAAQVARSQGDEPRTRLLLEEMLEHKETEYLAARSLSDAAGKQQLYPRALELAERAQSVNPQGLASVVGLHVRLGQWQQAQHAVTRALRKGHISWNARKRYAGIAYVQHGLQLLRDAHPEAALAAARHALKALPDFAPAVILAARAYAACQQPNKAIRLIYRAWKKSPQPELAECLRDIMVGEPKEKQMKRVRKLAALHPSSSESDLAIAETAVAHKDWGAARKALKAALAKEESARACRLMAAIEQNEFSDYDAGGRWLARAAAAGQDPAWVCQACGQAAVRWDAHCPSCDAFDTLEWKKRQLKFAA